MNSTFSRFILAFVVVIASVTVICAQVPDELKQLLSPKVDKFSQVSSAKLIDKTLDPSAFGGVPPVATEYRSPAGEKFVVSVFRSRSDTDSYSGLTHAARKAEETTQRPTQLNREIGTSSFRTTSQISFFKGTSLVHVSTKSGNDFARVEDGIALARALADRIDKGEGDIPPLVKHLPDPENSQNSAVYFSKVDAPGSILPGQAVLTALETNGDADAVIARIGQSKVLIVEFNTPQLATDNDQRIVAKIHELWDQGQPAPTAYRRVGNYAVMVFDAPDQKTANQLIDQVKYEQVVQWLGENPNILKEAQRRYVDTTLGVFIAVVKASGFALIGCLGAGGLIGALLFSRRRAQQRQVEAFSDAGGMLRLNLDELTPKSRGLLRDRN
ncbi:MAG TPA: DUF6599 family protein [Pyrinomonadaceae bacterium]|nr:DUF6599 family protein [Pyrinomonadaceae bacterium]